MAAEIYGAMRPKKIMGPIIGDTEGCRVTAGDCLRLFTKASFDTARRLYKASRDGPRLYSVKHNAADETNFGTVRLA